MSRLSGSSSLLAVALVYLCCSIGVTEAQENAQLQIPPSLVECYNTSYFMNRDNRLPSNLETLITLIEKVENSYGFDQDITQLSIALLHRFRQDGIQRAPGVVASPGVIPYSPIGFQFPKFRILLSRLIPGNALRFPNNTLTREERCSLHFMLSSSFDTQVRGDENQVCNNLSQYRAQRLPRALAAPQLKRNNFIGDVEILDGLQSKKPVPGAKQRMNPMNYDYDWDDMGYGYGSDSNTISQCPVENGVIRTKWGNVAAGNLIAGIAAGLQPQTVQLKSLLALSPRRGGYVQNMPQVATVGVDNRWAATVAGDLAEVALVQVPVSSTGQATVGASGAWNSTVMPKWYFLSQRQNMEMTDAEIRGGLDGLIIALNIQSWRQQVSNLKLSQLLRMYYSLDGVLNSGIMACNRATYFTQNIQMTTMNVQASAFAQVLDREMQLRVTLSPDAIATFAASAASALGTYIPNMNDLSCSVSSALPQDVSQSITPMTNIFVFLDTSWPYYQIVDYVNYVLENLNINPYASSVTLLAAQDGSVIVNTTNYISNVFEAWNVTTHATFAQGFNLPNVLRTVQNLTYNYMNVQQTNSSVGGLSLVALMIPNMATISATDSSYATTQLQYINEQMPDLRFIYYAGGTVSRFSSFVQDPTKDLFPLTVGTNAATAGGPVVMRIKKIPRQIVNPRCGAAWYTSTWGTNQMAQYINPGYISFYRLSPNYFYGATSGRYLNIQSQSSSVQYVICTSRSVVLPQQNSSNSSSDQTCVTLQGNTFSYDLSSACSGYYTIHQCPPLYVSVQAPASVTTQTYSCTDPACQSPVQTRYVMSVVNLGCFSGVAGLSASLLTLLLALMAPQLF
uniref:N-acetylmuramoyl-L-alanine amidase n=1 Tax=Musca domestica TaxID=7370 RepID=A0A1I8N3I3_MUSDO